jgi:flagellin
MALVVNTNVASITSQMYVNQTNKDMADTMTRLSSGKRINTAADDAAGVAISSRLSSEIRGANQSIRNAMDAQALIDTAEGAHAEVESILQRMRELSVQAANDTNNDTDRAALQLEVDQLLTEIDRIAQSTTWAGKGLLNGTASGTVASSFDDKATYNFQIGTTAGSQNVITADIGAVTSAALGLTSGSTTSSVSSTEGPARMSISGGTVKVEGALVHGDTFSFDLNDVEVEVAYSTVDEYTNDAAGLGAQIKDKIDELVAAGTITSPVEAVDNGDGTVSISVSEAPVLASPVATTAGN